MKEIREFIRRNIIITIICVFSLLICISYCITYNMQDYLGIEAWYSFLNNVSISYIAAFIFYIFQVYVPQINGEKLAIEAIKPEIFSVEKMICLTVACLTYYVEYKDDGGALIKWDETEPVKKIYFKYGNKLGECKLPRSITETEILKLDSEYNQKVLKIKNSNYSKYFSTDLVRLLDELEKVTLFKEVILTLKLADGFLNIKSLGLAGTKVQPIIQEMHQMFSFDTTWVIEEANEIESLIADIPRNIGQFKDIKDFNAKTLETYVENSLKKQLKDKNIKLSEADWKMILETVTKSSNN